MKTKKHVKYSISGRSRKRKRKKPKYVPWKYRKKLRHRKHVRGLNPITRALITAVRNLNSGRPAGTTITTRDLKPPPQYERIIGGDNLRKRHAADRDPAGFEVFQI